jgi:HD-GYP domain-containing protein (c-di-GMP phosphodiesterase class II)
MDPLVAAMVASVDMLAAAMAAWDVYTASHQGNVADLAARIGGRLGLDADRLLGLRLGATVHDIGKIASPLEVLSRSGPLTDAELDQIRGHAAVGARIVGAGRWRWPLAEMLHQHHERLDGSGYPRGLKGAQILYEARIIAVADVYDAIRHDRPYRKGPGKGHALQVLAAGRGLTFDPDVVDALLGVLATGFDLPASQLS